MTESPVVEELQARILHARSRGDETELRDLQDRYRRLGVAESMYFDADGRLEHVERGDPTIEMWRNGPVIGSVDIADTESTES